MTREPSGFPPGSAPARAGPAHARRGRDRLRARAWNNATSTTSCWPPISEVHSQNVRPRVALIAWHLLSDPAAQFADLGPDWHDRLAPLRRKRQLIAELERLSGKKVLLQEAA